MACTDPARGELKGSFELNLLSPDEKHEFEAHLLECDHCFEELYRSAPVVELIRNKKLAPENGATENVSRPGRRKVLSWALVAATVLVVAAGFLVLRKVGPPEETERLRGGGAGSIVVFAPIGEVPTPTELDWKTVPGAEAYELRIVTPSGESVWEETAKAPPARIPDSVREMLRPGESYFWQVEAVSKTGERWRSPSTRFSIWR